MLAAMIIIVLGAGVIATFVKSGKTTPTALPTSSPTTAITVIPSTTATALASPTTTATPSETPSPTNSLKKNPQDDMHNTPETPKTGVGWYPQGFAFVLAAAAVSFWIRRAART